MTSLLAGIARPVSVVVTLAGVATIAEDASLVPETPGQNVADTLRGRMESGLGLSFGL